MKILVAEDEPDIALLYKIGFEARGHEVLLAEDGEECLEIYREALEGAKSTRTNVPPFDVVVLDYKMPKGNGLDVAKQIQKLSPLQRIVFASAYVMESLVNSVQKLYNAQDVDMIDKPFEFDEFADLIEGVVIVGTDGHVYE